MSLIEKLSGIQQKMKAPKNLYNTFGKYNYRNAEGILEAFKPFEAQYKVALTVSDQMVLVGGRIYVQAMAILRDCESQEEIATTAFAREPEDKKGMDDSQITGTASSYARKYALNGLFLLDDSKDPDTDEYRNEQEERKSAAARKNGTGGKRTDTETGRAKNGGESKGESEKRIAAKRAAIEAICKKHNLAADMVCRANSCVWEEMTEAQLENMMASLKKKFGDTE